PSGGRGVKFPLRSWCGETAWIGFVPEVRVQSMGVAMWEFVRLPVVRRMNASLTPQRRRTVRSAGRPRVQPKLVVGPHDDRFEQEADSMAERVVAALDSPAALRSDGARALAPLSRVQRLPRFDPAANAAVAAGAGLLRRGEAMGPGGGAVDDDVERTIRTQ